MSIVPTAKRFNQTITRSRKRRARGFLRVLLILPLLPVLGTGFVGCSGSDNTPPLPETPKLAVTDEYHGVEVTENYRWLEDTEDPKVTRWRDAQNNRTRHLLGQSPHREAIYKRMDEMLSEGSTEYYSLKYAGGKLFAMKFQPPHEQSFLVTSSFTGKPEEDKVVIDPVDIDPDATTAIDFYVPSPDGQLVAVSLSEKGSEKGDVYVYDVQTGARLEDMVPRVNGPTAGGDVVWKRDNSGFYYTRYPRTGEREDKDLDFYQQVYFHTLGTSTDDDYYAIGKEFPKIAEIELDASDDGSLFMATVSNGDGGEYAHYLLGPGGNWRQITEFKDLIPKVHFGSDNSLYLLSRMGAPRGQVLRMAPGATSLARAKVIVPESDVTIQSMLPTATLLYTVDLVGGPKQIRVFDHKGNPRDPIPVKPISSVKGMVNVGSDDILFNVRSYVDPPSWMAFDASEGTISATHMREVSRESFDDIEVVREIAISKDGTRVPMNILRVKGTELNAQNPTILYGYGGYGISQSPYFDATRRLWFDQGGVYVVANIRGGGEFGEEWHLAGNLTNKQNVFDDFAACAEYLIDSGYTQPSKLAIRGGSNGGLLMGAALTQHPELFAAVVTRAGIYDMLRTELEPNGEFNITEFGTVKDKAQFEALYGYSPYHHVEDGTAYPAVLFTTGAHDGRVNPWQSRKMVARLQEATSSDRPILLRTSATSGHGRGTALSEKIDKNADIYAFLLDQLDMQYKQ